MTRVMFDFSAPHLVIDSEKGIFDDIGNMPDELFMSGGISRSLDNHEIRLVVFGNKDTAVKRFADQFNAKNPQIEDEDESVDDLVIRRWVDPEDSGDVALENVDIFVYIQYKCKIV